MTGQSIPDLVTGLRKFNSVFLKATPKISFYALK